MADTITVPVLNARTGAPLKNKMVTVQWGPWEKSEITLDMQGTGTVAIPAGAREFTLTEGPKVGDQPYRVAYLDCNEPPLVPIQISLVIEKGFVPKNACSGKIVAARPGEVVFWGLPRPWWIPDFQ